MDGIGKQCDAAGIINNDNLDESGYEQAGKRPLHHPYSPLSGEDRRSDNPMRMRMAVGMIVIFMMVVPVIMSMRMVMIMVIVFMIFSVKNHSP